MPTEVLTIGPVHVLTEDAIYALPTRACRVIASDVCEVSFDSATTGFAALAASTTGFDNAFAFIRCTTTTAQISCKAY